MGTIPEHVLIAHPDVEGTASVEPRSVPEWEKSGWHQVDEVPVDGDVELDESRLDEVPVGAGEHPARPRVKSKATAAALAASESAPEEN